MRPRHKRAMYLIGLVVVIALGICSRRYGTYLPAFMAEYAGDTLWALMVFLGFGFLAPTLGTSRRAGLAIATCCAVEVSQLYHAPWIDALRQTTLGGLVLGFGFLWSDLVCYTVGVALGATAEALLVRSLARNH